MHSASTALTFVLSLAIPIAAQTIPYYHMWADTTGVPHVSQCNFTDLQLQLLSTGDSPQYLDKIGSTFSNGTYSNTNFTTDITFTVQPAGWSTGWHENPKVQFIVPLSGSWTIHMTDGSMATMGPGEVALGEDQFATAISSGEYAGAIGHNATNVGDEAVNLMIVQTDWIPKVGEPCWLE
ncbi:hypothetical protein N7536_002045 [Penicillium majusculum]|uniref:Cupin 2 conserved barrel domain-containing protein n=1 Tax=Penicillium solitum TaxID=60172 RepID=A0A1V6QRR0_9EURO|nr:uncharacterized protein PENSOL_c047G05010 [Penicillium solitum]KAJ5706356.1 hypothetical protein N7536_002045 [Penicillium majusculum]OQD91913.1 hypothetical protein PENSOL_c047G05010 [Penicillium solitum]